MKTLNQQLTALILILALAFSAQVYASTMSQGPADEKKLVKINMKAPLVQFITQSLDISEEDINTLKEQINEANFYILNNSDAEIELTIEE